MSPLLLVCLAFGAWVALTAIFVALVLAGARRDDETRARERLLADLEQRLDEVEAAP